MRQALFNIAADALNALMVKAKSKGLIHGVVEHLLPTGITHIQYVDEIILIVDGFDSSILNLKIILYYFEWLFGLKINFHKSEFFFFWNGSRG